MPDKVAVVKVPTITTISPSISNLRKLWLTTKNALIVRPKFPNDLYTTLFSYPAAELVKKQSDRRRMGCHRLAG
jgi:hypothetical protein